MKDFIIDFYDKYPIWVITTLFTILTTNMFWNYLKYKKYIGVWYEDIYHIDTLTDSRQINWDRENYIKVINGFIDMGRHLAFPIGIFTLPISIIMWFSLSKLYYRKSIGETLIDSQMSSEDYYYKYEKEFKIFNFFFPLFYRLIHWTSKGSIYHIFDKRRT